MPRCLAITFVGAVLLISTACKHQPAPQLPPPPLLPTAPKPAEEPAPLPAPPVIEPDATEFPAPIMDVGALPAPPPEGPEAPSAPVFEPAPAPSLAPMLPPEQRRTYQAELASSLVRTQRHLGLLAQRSLTPQQEILRNRVRTFMHQAEAVRSTDLATAHGLARRAELLAQDLVNATR